MMKRNKVFGVLSVAALVSAFSYCSMGCKTSDSLEQKTETTAVQTTVLSRDKEKLIATPSSSPAYSYNKNYVSRTPGIYTEQDFDETHSRGLLHYSNSTKQIDMGKVMRERELARFK